MRHQGRTEKHTKDRQRNASFGDSQAHVRTDRSSTIYFPIMEDFLAGQNFYAYSYEPMRSSRSLPTGTVKQAFLLFMRVYSHLDRMSASDLFGVQFGLLRQLGTWKLSAVLGSYQQYLEAIGRFGHSSTLHTSNSTLSLTSPRPFTGDVWCII